MPRETALFELLEPRRLYAQTGYWAMDDGTNSTAVDSSGSNTNATGYSMSLLNLPVWQTAGMYGGALSFNGTTQYGSPGVSPGTAATLSVSFWFKANALKNQFVLDKTPNDASGLGWGVRLSSDGGAALRIGSGSNFTEAKVTAAYAANTWTQFTATFSGGVAKVYINGQLKLTQSGITQSPANTTTTLRVAIPSVVNTTEAFGGVIDEVKLWDQVLTPTAIARQYDVDQLPETSAANRLKKATLQWAIEDANADDAFGNAAAAASTLTDVQTLLTQAIGSARPSPTNLFPTIPNIGSNPILTDAITRLNRLRANNARLDKDPATYTVAVSGGSYLSAFSGSYNDGLQGAWALGDTQTSLYGDPKLLVATLRRFERVYGAINGGVTVADFGQTSEIAQMYLMFKTVYPDLLLPSKKTAWEKALKTDADKVLADHKATYLAAVPGTLWVNADVRFAAGLGYDALIFPTNTTYAAAANACIKLIADTVYPDGGMPYFDNQNEDYTYHGINISTLARYWQITGNTNARDAVVKSYWYYPLTAEGPGVVNYAAMPAWKHYWNQVKDPDEAYLVGSMANSPENMEVFQRMTGGSFAGLGTLFLSSFHNPAVVSGVTRDNFITYDRNDLGPRGRFGNWSFTGTTNELAGENRGQASFVGAMLLDSGTSSSWPLNAALDSAASRIMFANGEEVGAPDQRNLFYDLTQNTRAATTVTNDFASISTVYNAAKYGETASRNWVGQQEWLYTPQRLVGLVSMRSTATQSAYDVEGILKLVSGRGTWGNVRSFVVTTDPDGIKRYTYGGISVRILAHNYGGVYVDYNDTFGLNGDSPSEKTGRIRFIDPKALAAGGFDPNDTRNSQKDLVTSSYTSSTNHYYMVEIMPSTTAAASGVQVEQTALSTGLRGIRFTENGRSLRLIQNPTANPLTLSTNIDWATGAVVHTPGEKYRPDWLGTYNPADTDFRGRRFSASSPYGVKSGAFTYTIPAYGHVVLETNYAPTVATEPSVAALNRNVATLNFLGADDAGEAGLTYTWSVTGTPPGQVAFSSANGTNTGKSATATFSKAGSYNLQVVIADASGTSVTRTLGVQILPTAFAPTVSSFSVNAGSAQRSRVTTLSIVFDQPVSLASNAFSLTTSAGGTVAGTVLNLSNASGDQMRYDVTFAGTAILAGSLADGSYVLTVNAASVTNAAGLAMAANTSYAFYRLFGDIDANRAVNFNDFLVLQNAFGTNSTSAQFPAGLDGDGNDLIDFNDFLLLQNNFGKTI